MRVKIKPVCGRLLLNVMPPEKERVLPGGLIAPGVSKDTRGTFREAFVQALPDGYAGDLLPGDRVLVPPYAGTEAMVNRERLVFVLEKDVLAALD